MSISGPIVADITTDGDGTHGVTIDLDIGGSTQELIPLRRVARVP